MRSLSESRSCQSVRLLLCYKSNGMSICQCVKLRISLAAYPIWFSFTAKLFLSPEKEIPKRKNPPHKFFSFLKQKLKRGGQPHNQHLSVCLTGNKHVISYLNFLSIGCCTRFSDKVKITEDG